MVQEVHDWHGKNNAVMIYEKQISNSLLILSERVENI